MILGQRFRGKQNIGAQHKPVSFGIANALIVRQSLVATLHRADCRLARSRQRDGRKQRLGRSNIYSVDRFLLDHDLQVRGHVLVQLHRDGELAHGLQRLVQLDLAAIHVEALLGQRVADIARRDRSKELIVLARRRWNDTETPSNCFASSSACVFSLAERRTEAAFICAMTALLPSLAWMASLRGRQIIPSISFRDLHHVAARPQLRYIFFQNDFHG